MLFVICLFSVCQKISPVEFDLGLCLRQDPRLRQGLRLRRDLRPAGFPEASSVPEWVEPALSVPAS